MSRPQPITVVKPEDTAKGVDTREQRGITIPRSAKFTRKGRSWIVPSQSKDYPNTVDLD
jgi:hypothetical protein